MDWRITTIKKRSLADGGFADRPGGQFRPDATCWAILALRAAHAEDDLAQNAAKALAATQHPDGRVCVSRQHEDAYWPTSLAILAWAGLAQYEGPRNRALRFLTDCTESRTGQHTAGTAGHDPTIQGWSWVAGTHSWVEPTAYGLMALRVCGYGEHARATEAQRLLLDRQLSRGGWNCGNTVVFGQELRPVPETTGAALQALAGLAPTDPVHKSISYLRARVPSLRTPLSIAWAILGLSAWQTHPENEHQHLVRIMAQPSDPEHCSTVGISLLALASSCVHGLVDFLLPASSEGES